MAVKPGPAWPENTTLMAGEPGHLHPCEKCGECCRHISGIPELAEYDRGDGVCIHLKGVLCEIYDHRPDICNVETMFRKVFSKSMTREEFFAKNLDACKVLMKMKEDREKGQLG